MKTFLQKILGNTKCNSAVVFGRGTGLLIYCGFIFWLSSLSDPGPSNLPPGTDKVVHFCIYAALGFLSQHFFVVWRLTANNRPALWSFFFAVAYGVSDEFHQSFVPGRFPSSADLFFDALGAGFGIMAYLQLRRWVRHS